MDPKKLEKKIKENAEKSLQAILDMPRLTFERCKCGEALGGFVNSAGWVDILAKHAYVCPFSYIPQCNPCQDKNHEQCKKVIRTGKYNCRCICQRKSRGKEQ